MIWKRETKVPTGEIFYQVIKELLISKVIIDKNARTYALTQTYTLIASTLVDM